MDLDQDNSKAQRHGLWVARIQNAGLLSRLFLRKPLFFFRLLWSYFQVLAFGKKPLRFMDIAIDYDCNMNCSHCSATIMKRPDTPTLSVSEYKEISRKLRRDGCLVFHFTGGEPFLRDDLEQVIKAFGPGKCMISVQTNGQLVTRERLLSLKRIGVDMICVSIDSGIPEEHEAFRRKKGAFPKAVEAVKTARELGFRSSISTCITHGNLKSEGLRKIIELCESLQVWCFFNLAVPAGNWVENEDMLLTPEDRIEMERIMKEHPCCRTDFESNYFKRGCAAVKEKLYMTPYGDIMPCPFIQISLGNVKVEPVGLIRSRALKHEIFNTYHQVCIAAEDRDFISKCPCYSQTPDRPPIFFGEVPWLAEKMKS